MDGRTDTRTDNVNASAYQYDLALAETPKDLALPLPMLTSS